MYVTFATRSSIYMKSQFFCRSGNISSIDRERRYTDECKSVMVHWRHTTLRPHPRESEKDGFISRRVVECIKHLFTHCDIADGRHHIRVLRADFQLQQQRQDKHYYSHNRCDIAVSLLLLFLSSSSSSSSFITLKRQHKYSNTKYNNRIAQKFKSTYLSTTKEIARTKMGRHYTNVATVNNQLKSYV